MKTQVNTQESIKNVEGLSLFKVVGMNPKTLEEFEKLGLDYIKEVPEYKKVKEDDGKKYIELRFDFILKPVNTGEKEEYNNIIKNKRVVFIINSKNIESKTGKHQYINDLGVTLYAEKEESLNDYSWFVDNKSYRKAYMGEERLVKFIKSFGNIGYNSSCYFDEPKNLFNLKENSNILNTVKAGKSGVYCLLYMNDQNKNVIYNDFYTLSENYNKWKNHLDNAYKPIKISNLELHINKGTSNIDSKEENGIDSSNISFENENNDLFNKDTSNIDLEQKDNNENDDLFNNSGNANVTKVTSTKNNMDFKDDDFDEDGLLPF